jgi:ABC-type multidrug transport system ATPase subunit
MRMLINYIQERENKIRHVMISQGLPPEVYWVATTVHVAFQIHFFASIVCLTIWAYGDTSFTSRGRFPLIWFGAFVSPVPILIFFYNCSIYFNTTESAQRIVGLIMAGGASIGMIQTQFWALGAEGPMDGIGMKIHLVLCLVNPFYLMNGVLLACWRAGGLEVPGNKSRPGNGKDFRGMLGWELCAPFTGQLCLSLVLYFVPRLRRLAFLKAHRAMKPVEQSSVDVDDDVLAEEERVRTTSPQAEACLYRNLRHTYGDKNEAVEAVRGISLGIKRGECFGLLGPNGAGKTTTLGCLTGEICPPTSGEVFVAGHSILDNSITEAYQSLGYCPQVDPVFPNLSGRKNLYFYGRLKGVPAPQIAQTVEALLQRLGIETADRDKIAEKYSGGMKRKLSLGIALIGRSNVLFLDEPTAAVDAASKRLLWQAIKRRAADRTVIITTHSMEEAEAVCDRIAIQVLGRLRCLGTPMHLKNKYSSGYQVEVRLKRLDASETTDGNVSERGDELLKFIRHSLSNDIQLLESYDNSYVIQLPLFEKGVLTLGKVFTELEGAKQTLDIEEYTLSQASLEQVFLRFAREQDAGTKPQDTKGKVFDWKTIINQS